MTHRQSPTRALRGYGSSSAFTSVQHVGLAHEKLAPHATAADKDAQSRFIRGLAQGSSAPRGYELHFRRHVRRTLSVDSGRWHRKVGVVVSQGRVLCGLGELTPTENGLTVHQTYGVPVLPGSSLKGITRAWLRASQPENSAWAEGGALWNAAFGRPPPEEKGEERDSGEAGLVHFLDALWVPAEPDLPLSPWAAEILTPHFGQYYSNRSGRDPAPDGTESPIPVTFLAAQGGFRLVAEGPPGLLEATWQHMIDALRHRGVGAKSRSGFGRLALRADHELSRADVLEVVAQQERRLQAARDAAFAAARDVASTLEALRQFGGDSLDLHLALVRWLQRHPETDSRLSRFDVTPESAVAAFGWAEGANVVRGVLKKVRDALDPEVLAAVRPPEEAKSEDVGAVPVAGGFGPNRWDTLDEPTGNKKAKKNWPGQFTSKIVRGEFDEDTVRRAIAHVRKHGGKDGHVADIRKAYGMDDAE